MTTGLKNLIRLSAADEAAVERAIDRIDAARVELEGAVDALALVSAGFESELGKVRRSALGVGWEKTAVANRLAELHGRDKQRGQHNVFGCTGRES
jgi:hypothetical protein